MAKAEINPMKRIRKEEDPQTAVFLTIATKTMQIKETRRHKVD